MKPWDPPEEHLYPVLDDLLDDWWASFKPPYEGIKVIGMRWSPRSYEVKHFLARNGIPYQWLDIESDEGRHLVSFIALASKGGESDQNSGTFMSNTNFNQRENDTDDTDNTSSLIRSPSSTPFLSSLKLPLIIFPDGSFMDDPPNSGLAEKIGLKTQALMHFYDLIIIGAGPAGLAAAVYGAPTI